jgi:hypothetical protein
MSLPWQGLLILIAVALVGIGFWIDGWIGALVGLGITICIPIPIMIIGFMAWSDGGCH